MIFLKKYFFNNIKNINDKKIKFKKLIKKLF
jgi:hypothetical protein